MDRWLSVVSHLLSQVPVVGGTLGDGIQEFLLAVIKERTNPDTLPGLEAMMPGSALVALLNEARAPEQRLPIPGFEPITADLGSAPARGIADKRSDHHEHRPVLFVLPGIMGSELSVDDDEV
jgi:hypothetical protein